MPAATGSAEPHPERTSRTGLNRERQAFIDVDQEPFREAAWPAVERALAGMADGVVEDIEAAIAATRQ